MTKRKEIIVIFKIRNVGTENEELSCKNDNTAKYKEIKEDKLNNDRKKDV